jgi:hypothetical protein
VVHTGIAAIDVSEAGVESVLVATVSGVGSGACMVVDDFDEQPAVSVTAAQNAVTMKRIRRGLVVMRVE